MDGIRIDCRRITDVSALRNVHTLNLYSTGVTDVSALTHVDTLDLIMQLVIQIVNGCVCDCSTIYNVDST